MLFNLIARGSGSCLIRRSPAVWTSQLCALSSAKYAHGDFSVFYASVSEQSPDVWSAVSKIIRERAGAKPEILDFTSGPGIPAQTMAKNFPQAKIVSAVVSNSNTDIDTVTNLQEVVENPNFECIQVKPENCAMFPKESFDFVNVCLEHTITDESEKIISEARRILRPNGYFVLTYWSTLSTYDCAKRIMTEVAKDSELQVLNPPMLSTGQVEKKLGSAGFMVEDVAKVNYNFEFIDEDQAFHTSLLPIIDQFDALFRQGKTESEVMKSAKRTFFEFTKEHCLEKKGVYSFSPNIANIVVSQKA